MSNTKWLTEQIDVCEKEMMVIVEDSDEEWDDNYLDELPSFISILNTPEVAMRYVEWISRRDALIETKKEIEEELKNRDERINDLEEENKELRQQIYE